MRVRIRRLPHAADLPAPARASTGSAGYDLRAAVSDDVELAPGDRCLVPTGFAVAIPEGFEGQIRPRSGLALRHGITLVNSPGTVDSDYRGEVEALLTNLGSEPFVVRRGDRIAQIVFTRIERVEIEECVALPETSRGEGGFGSTGRD